MQFNVYSQHLILDSHPSLSILMAFSFQSLANSLRKKTGFISKQTNCCRLLVHQNPWESREKKFGRTNSEQQNLWHDHLLFQLFLEKENTAFSLPVKVFHDYELIQSQDEAVTNVQKLEEKNRNLIRITSFSWKSVIISRITGGYLGKKEHFTTLQITC